MKSKRISIAVTVFALAVMVSLVWFNGVRAGLFSKKTTSSTKSKPVTKPKATPAPEKKKISLFGSKKKTAVAPSKAGEDGAKTPEEKKKKGLFGGIFNKKPKTTGTESGKPGEPKEKKKGFFGSLGSSLKNVAKKAASSSAVKDLAKKAKGAVVSLAKKGAETVAVLVQAAKNAAPALYAQLKKFNLDEQQLNMTIETKSKGEDGEEVASDLGFTYDFGYTGLGNSEDPLAEIPGVFQSKGGGAAALGVDLFVSKMPGEVGELFREIKVLSPKMHFFFKFIAVCNSLGLIPTDGAKVSLDEPKRKQLIADLTILSSRYSHSFPSDPSDAKKTKPSDMINKLPKFLRTFIEAADMPDMFTEYDVLWERDCAGKPISAMRKEVANMRAAFDYTDRTLIAEENIIPLIEENVVGTLTETDFNWLAYALKHHLYDMDKGPELQALDAEHRHEEINARANEMVVLFSAVIARIPDAHQAIANDLHDHLQMFAHETQDENGDVWEALDTIEIKIDKPLMGGDAENKVVHLPLPQMLDILYAKSAMFSEDGFEIDGVFPDGKYLWDDSSLSETNMRDSVAAIALRVIKERSNETFNADNGGTKGFMKYELAKLYHRSPKIMDYLADLLGPFGATLTPIVGEINSILDGVKAMGDTLDSIKEVGDSINNGAAAAPVDTPAADIPAADASTDGAAVDGGSAGSN